MNKMAVHAMVGLLCVGSALAASGQSISPPALSLTLDEAIRRGLDTSHRLAETSARGEAAAAVAAQRRSAMLPVVSVQAGYQRTNHVDVFGLALPGAPPRIIYPDVPDNVRTRLDWQWPIFTSGRLDALQRAARAEAEALSGDLVAAREDLTLEITRAYWAVITAREAERVVDESVRRVGAHLQDVRNQLAAGLVPPNDVMRIEAQESRQRMLAIQARTQREVAEADLARLIGVDPETPIQPVAAFDPPPVPAAGVRDLFATAKAQRAERAALMQRRSAADERGRAAAAGLKPTVAVGGGFDYARPNPRIFPRADAWSESWDVGLSITWPLFDGGRTRADVAEARASSRAVQERLADFDQTLTTDIRQRLAELRASRAVIDAANDAIRSAEEARRVVTNRFDAGVATSTDVLDAQVALLQAQLDRTQAIASARLAEARLARATGK